MSTFNSFIDIINPTTNGIIEVRRVDQTLDDSNNVISQAFVRWTLFPGQDVTNQWPAVQAVCANTWTPAVIAAYQASFPPTPPRPTQISKRDFLNRFSVGERIAIRQAAKTTDVIAEDFIHLLDISDTVTLTDKQTVDGLNYCVQMGYVSAANANTILTP